MERMVLRSVAALCVALLTACAGTGFGTRILDDPELGAFLHQRLCIVAAADCTEIRIVIQRRPPLVAELRPDGTLRIGAALLLRVRDLDELDFVLAHEAAHRQLDHFAQRELPGWNLERAETEADRAAARTLDALGRRSDGGLRLLHAIGRETGQSGSASLMDTRIRALQATAAAQDHAPGGADTWRDLARYRRLDWLDDDVARDRPQRLLALLDHLDADAEPDAVLQLIRARALLRRGQTGDADAAAALLAHARSDPALMDRVGPQFDHVPRH